MKQIFSLIVACIAALTLTGCAKYKAKPLSRLSTHAASAQEKNHVVLSYRVFSKDDCMAYLDRDVIAKGFLPIHITLTNNSEHALIFDSEGFSFPCVPATTVAESVHTNTAKRVIGYSIAGLFFPLFFIPAVVDGVGSSQANEQLDRDFYLKTLHSQQIKPYSVLNGLIFVYEEDFTPYFTLTLTVAETYERVTFEAQKLWAKI